MIIPICFHKHIYIFIMFVAHLLDVGVYGPFPTFPTYPSRRGQGIHLSHKHVKKVCYMG